MVDLPDTFVLRGELHEALTKVMRRGRGTWDQTLGGLRYPMEELSADEVQLAKDAGLLPNHRVEVSHDDAVERLRTVSASLEVFDVASAFVACFDPEAFDPVAFGGLIHAVQGWNLPKHTFKSTSRRCEVCRFDAKERVDFAEVALQAQIGGVVQASYSAPLKSAAALEVFAAAERPLVTNAACRNFSKLFRSIARAKPDARAATLRAKLTTFEERGQAAHALLTLGTIGVLATEKFRGFYQRNVELPELFEVPHAKMEVDPPISFWKASDGVSDEAFAHYFGHLGLSLP